MNTSRQAMRWLIYFSIANLMLGYLLFIKSLKSNESCIIFNHNRNLNIAKKELRKLFLFDTSQTHFIFNSKFYNQIDGVAMDSPLSPVLANIFMGFRESKWLNEYSIDKPKFYLRYVDDILAAFDNEQDSLNFLDFLSNRYPNIKFSIEKQINHSIAFLNILILVINSQNLTLQTYCKSTYTGLFLNLNSFTLFSYKISLIECLLGRLKFLIIGTIELKYQG